MNNSDINLNDTETKFFFENYLINVHKIKNRGTAREYVKHLDKAKEWFVIHGLCNLEYDIWQVNSDHLFIINSLNTTHKELWKNAAKKGGVGDSGFMMASWNRWIEFKLWFLNQSSNKRSSILVIAEDIKLSNLIFPNLLTTRFIASLLTKPFVILTGLSGSGKTKLAQAFVQWICQDESQYRIIPVGADWTNREPLLGYPNALKPKEYVKPDSGVLDLIIQANQSSELPHFLILDEMNLSHVERYFADFLSVMESKEEIPLYAEGAVENGVPSKLKVPSNLFFVGTVNIDETTNMFSPKVLDRANTIEFRVTQVEMENFLSKIKDIKMDALTSKGAGMAKSFLEMAAIKDFVTTDIDVINAALVQFFVELKKIGAEFGYRSATEIIRLINQLTVLDNTLTTYQKIDIAIIQKLLPKLHGSRRKLCPVLETLGTFCIIGDVKIVKDVFETADFNFNNTNVIYPLSLEKITRMYRGAVDNGFASFAEA
jgi:5-methylcytosine-specific restriction protein B